MTTIKDSISRMNPSQTDTFHVVVGAAIEDQPLNEEYIKRYNALSKEHKNIIDFFVGNLIQPNSVLKHSDISEVYLAHYGVKGMKWGVRKSDSGSTTRLSKSVLNTSEMRKDARARVAEGSQNVVIHNIAKLKSTGHRAVNALTGDKQFWRNTAITAGISTAALASTIIGVDFLPTSLLEKLGSETLYSALKDASRSENIEMGKTVAGVAGASLVSFGAATATAANFTQNLGRAVFGNRRVDKDTEKLGLEFIKRQRDGKKRVAAVAGGG